MAGVMNRWRGLVKASKILTDFSNAGLGLFDSLSGNRMRAVFENAGAPSNGGGGTLNGIALPNDLLLDITNGNLYINTNTQASPTWTQIPIAGKNSMPASTATLFGGGTGTFLEEGNLVRQVPGVTGGINPGATAADNVIFAATIPASSFDATGRGVAITAVGNFGATANAKRVKLILNPATAVVGSTVGAGGITISDTGSVTQNGGAWSVGGQLFKRGAGGSNTQVAVPSGVMLSGSHAGLTAAAQEVTATESGAILVAVTGNATTAATDIIGTFFECNAMN